MDFQGFQSSIPLWVYFLMAVAILYLSYRSYQNASNIKPSVKAVLVALRSLALLTILVLLLNPFFRRITEYEEKPQIQVYIDNSKSVALQKGDYQGISTISQVIDALNLKNSDGIDYQLFEVGNTVQPAEIDSLTFDKSETDLYEAFKRINDAEFSANAAIVISDGIYTIGRDPSFILNDIEIPIYTVTLGDTTLLNDVIVQTVDHPPVAYLNTNQTVTAQIQNIGFNGSIIEVRLLAGEELVESKRIEFTRDDEVISVSFDVTFDEEGIKQYRIEFDAIDGEWTAQNNGSSFNIEILDSKIQVLDIAFEFHPDVGAIRNTLREDENIQLIPKTFLQQNNFIPNDPFPSADSLELLVLHGLPSSQAALNFLQDYISVLPTVLFQTPNGLEVQGSPVYGNYILMNSFSTVDEVGLVPALERDQHPILELPDTDLKLLSPIVAKYRNVRLLPEAQSIFNVRFQNLETNQSLIAISEVGNRRKVHVNGYNWFKLNQSPRAEERQYFESLISNIVSWASSKPDDRRLKIRPQKSTYDASEIITLDAYLENESGSVETDARIDVEIEVPGSGIRNFTMQNIGDGNYSLDLPLSNDGIYSFNATARKGDRVIDEQSGEFSINPSNSELVNTVRNDALMNNAALSTNGKAYNHTEISSILDDMNDAGLLKSIKKEREAFYFPVHYPFWFIIVVVLLAAEWLIRKYFSLP